MAEMRMEKDIKINIANPFLGGTHKGAVHEAIQHVVDFCLKDFEKNNNTETDNLKVTIAEDDTISVYYQKSSYKPYTGELLSLLALNDVGMKELFARNPVFDNQLEEERKTCDILGLVIIKILSDRFSFTVDNENGVKWSFHLPHDIFDYEGIELQLVRKYLYLEATTRNINIVFKVEQQGSFKEEYISTRSLLDYYKITRNLKEGTPISQQKVKIYGGNPSTINILLSVSKEEHYAYKEERLNREFIHNKMNFYKQMVTGVHLKAFREALDMFFSQFNPTKAEDKKFSNLYYFYIEALTLTKSKVTRYCNSLRTGIVDDFLEQQLKELYLLSLEDLYNQEDKNLLAIIERVRQYQ